MKILSMMLALCFSLNVLAGSGTIKEFEKVLNDYQYSINVDWDQQDQKFLDQKTAELSDQVKALMASGLSQKELLTYLEGKIQSKEALEAVKLKTALLSKPMTQDEVLKTVSEVSKDLYNRGASWNGATVLYSGLALLLIYAIVSSIHFELTHECVRTELRYDCWDTGCFNYQYYCRTTCGYVDVCVEYVKK